LTWWIACKIKKDELYGARDVCGKEETFIQGFGGKIRMKEVILYN